MSSSNELLTSTLRPVVQVIGFLRKELVDIMRQPRVLIVLVAGPFLILMAFAAGYDQTSTQLRTVFVGPEGSVYEEAIAGYTESIERYVRNVDYTSDVVGAEDRVANGEADLVVVFPPDPVDIILGGDQAVITVLHDKLDPLQQTAVEISAQIAVQELNATVLEELVGQAQETLTPLEDSLAATAALSGELDAAAEAGDLDEVARLGEELQSNLDSIRILTTVSNSVVAELGGEVAPEQQEQLEALQASITEIERGLDGLDDASPAEVRDITSTITEQTATVAPLASELVVLDPGIVTRPFVADTENLLRTSTRVNDFFAPSAISLLLQHLALTFAALALVRDRSLGLFETFRVGPVAARHVLAGKYAAYLVIGGSVGAALVASVVFGLDVPFRGSIGWAALGIGLLVAASIGLGLVLSALARNDTQAVQFAMLALLAGLFFGGFFLSLDSFRYPVKGISWLLPVTYAIRLLQDVMLRGVAPSFDDIVGLSALTVVYGTIAGLLVRRELRVR